MVAPRDLSAAIDNARSQLAEASGGGRWATAAVRLLGLLDEAMARSDEQAVADALMDEAIELATHYLNEAAAPGEAGLLTSGAASRSGSGSI